MAATPRQAQGDRHHYTAAWISAGALLLALFAVMLAISPRFVYGGLPVLERPIYTLVALMMAAGAVYLLALLLLRRQAAPGRAWWVWVLGVGLGMRLLMLPSVPMLETDYYRYLWDGAVAAAGHNPFIHPPRAIREGDAPEPLLELAAESGLVIERVTHPQLATIYPPVSQAAFAAAHRVAPWRIEGLRLVFLAFDIIALGLLVLLLKRLALPAAGVVVYWWNPLLVKEVYNSTHMEIVVVAFLAAGLLLVVSRRWLLSSVALGLAAGAKLWPALLLPVMARQRGLSWGRFGVMALVFAAVCLAVTLPLLWQMHRGESGLSAYAGQWQVNAGLFQVIHAGAGLLPVKDVQATARLIVAALVVVWVIWLCRRPAPDGRAVCERALWATAALFMLAPAQYPWYWLWLLPMLVVRRSLGLLLLTALLPLYYLRFPLRELELKPWFDHGVVWLQYAPALALLVWECRRSTPAVEGDGRT